MLYFDLIISISIKFIVENIKWRVTVHLFASADRKEPQSVVRNGDIIILTHLNTNKNLHSHFNH